MEFKNKVIMAITLTLCIAMLLSLWITIPEDNPTIIIYNTLSTMLGYLLGIKNKGD